MKCKYCDSSESYKDETSNEEYCTGCGRILQEYSYAQQITFQNEKATGKTIGISDPKYCKSANRGYLSSDDPKKLTHAYKLIERIAARLNINHKCIKPCQRTYELLQSSGWTRGRQTFYVVASAMYITCRQSMEPYLLIDFSDFLQINLYTFASYYLKMLKHLRYELKPEDIPIYTREYFQKFCQKYCQKLDFGDATEKVAKTAERIVLRMQKDWMTYGRRPHGCIGAAIAISARIHGFKVTTAQIVQTVHVCDETIRKRINEFKESKVAKLTAEEFKNIDIEKISFGELDPPSFKKKELPLELETELKNNQKALNTSSELNDPVVKVILDEVVEEEEDNYVDTDGEDLANLSDSEVNQYILTPEEQKIKSIIWNSLNKEWVCEQNLKSEKEKIEKKNNNLKKRKKHTETINAGNPVTAIIDYSKAGSKMRKSALENLFSPTNLELNHKVNDDF